MYKKILLATTITILLSAIALPVLANPPYRFSGSFSEDPLLIASCPDGDGNFEVWTKDTTLYFDATEFYDKDNNPIKVIFHYWGEGIVWRPDTGKEVTMDSNLFNAIYFPETDEIISAGIQFQLTLPGEGTILMDVGRMIFQPYPENLIWESGQHPFYFPDEGGLEKLCAFFAE